MYSIRKELLIGVVIGLSKAQPAVTVHHTRIAYLQKEMGQFVNENINMRGPAI